MDSSRDPGYRVASEDVVVSEIWTLKYQDKNPKN